MNENKCPHCHPYKNDGYLYEDDISPLTKNLYGKDVEVFVKQVDKAIDQLQGICTGIDNWGDTLTLNEIKEDIKANVLNNLIKSSYTMHRKMEDNNYVK